jgi:hypothetical protein
MARISCPPWPECAEAQPAACRKVGHWNRIVPNVVQRYSKVTARAAGAKPDTDYVNRSTEFNLLRSQHWTDEYALWVARIRSNLTVNQQIGAAVRQNPVMNGGTLWQDTLDVPIGRHPAR